MSVTLRKHPNGMLLSRVVPDPAWPSTDGGSGIAVLDPAHNARVQFPKAVGESDAWGYGLASPDTFPKTAAGQEGLLKTDEEYLNELAAAGADTLDLDTIENF